MQAVNLAWLREMLIIPGFTAADYRLISTKHVGFNLLL
jgi:hypothetical protein